MIAEAPPRTTLDADAGPTSYLRVADALRHDIVQGRLSPGARLKMRELSECYEVSPQPVREALQVLQGEGLVVLEPNRGARVRGLDMARLRHIYELREAIEATLTRRFAEEASLSVLRKLEAIQQEHDAAVAAGDVARTDRANAQFHELIVEHSGNEEAIALRERYFALTNSLRRRFGFSARRWEAVRNDHHQLLDAIRRRDGLAAYTIASQHVRSTMEELMARIENGERPD